MDKENQRMSVYSQTTPPLSIRASTSSKSRPFSISTSSSNASTVSDPYSMSFLIDNQKYYNQVVEDLLVIDNVCDMFEEEEGYEPILSGNVFICRLIQTITHSVFYQEKINKSLM